MAGISKTMKKKSQVKGDKFQASGELSRFIPLKEGKVYFRNPEDGHTEHLTHAEADARLGDFQNHPSIKAMTADLTAIVQNQ